MAQDLGKNGQNLLSFNYIPTKKNTSNPKSVKFAKPYTRQGNNVFHIFKLLREVRTLLNMYNSVLLSDGKTPYKRRFGQPPEGPVIPFGSLVEYYPITAKDQSRIHQFEKKVLLGLFLGYALYAGAKIALICLLQQLISMDLLDFRNFFPKLIEVEDDTFDGVDVLDLDFWGSN